MEFILVIIVSLVLIIAALVYNGKAKARKRKKILEDLISNAAAEQRVKWDHREQGQHRAIAWSASGRLLAFAHYEADEERLTLIDMQEVADCRILETGHRGSGSEQHITGVALAFSFKDKSAAAVTLPFYSEALDGLFEKIILTQKARHWKEMIGA